jgi:Arc/MetJ-type ribon-helix-helix transcriptional regulator
MSIQATLPDELVAQIDDVSSDRNAFVTEAIRRQLRKTPSSVDETARINELADELNKGASEVLEYQVIS